MQIRISSQESTYPIFIEPGVLDKIPSLLPKFIDGNKLMIISDSNVFPLYGQRLADLLSNDFEVSTHVLPSGEKTKQYESLFGIYNALLDGGFTRSDSIIALGGGVIGDLAGFAAASFLRGIPFIQIPTSLLAQVDSSVGSKVGVDLPRGKNLVGAFYHPKAVFIDPDVLTTLSGRFIRDGMAEVIKYAAIRDLLFFEQLEKYDGYRRVTTNIQEIVTLCVDWKRKLVEQDLYDKGTRMLLNFGHTIGHAIEVKGDFEKETHGEAVSIGMSIITHWSEAKGLTEKGTAKRLDSLLEMYALPLRSEYSLDELKTAIAMDKKNLEGKLNLVLLKNIGGAYVEKTDVNSLIV
ncbi:MAG: 3-dehydroquinate synthase [Lachnospiraceae bacterium]|jgi:3-dehydroquinate synthase|nr:3-dehydroquinate synthase [Lachnospiraceae bacterium]